MSLGRRASGWITFRRGGSFRARVRWWLAIATRLLPEPHGLSRAGKRAVVDPLLRARLVGVAAFAATSSLGFVAALATLQM
jgi:hypothetical protein